MRDVYEILKEKNIVLPEPPAKGGVLYACAGNGRKVFVLFRVWPGSGKWK